MSIGQKIKDLRTAKGLTQRSFAQLFHVNNSTLAMWETDKNEPDIDTIKRLATYFDVTTDYLLGLTDCWGNITLSAGAISGNHNTVNSHNTINSVTPTTPDEAELLALWRTAPKEKKNAILQLLK